MEVKKIECPSCGAAAEWNSSACVFCKTELRFFEDAGAVLPINVSVEDIESKITLLESEFLQATINAIDAPYSRFKKYKHWSIQDFKNDLFRTASENMKIFYDTFLILPNENLVGYFTLNDAGGYALLTSLRVVIYSDTILLSIPLESLVSWGVEKSVSGTNVVARDGRVVVGSPVLRYSVGESEKSIRFTPDDKYLPEVLLQSVMSCKEWEDLDAFQKNLVRLSRYDLKQTFKIQIRSFESMAYVRPAYVRPFTIKSRFIIVVLWGVLGTVLVFVALLVFLALFSPV